MSSKRSELITKNMNSSFAPPPPLFAACLQHVLGYEIQVPVVMKNLGLLNSEQIENEIRSRLMVGGPNSSLSLPTISPRTGELTFHHKYQYNQWERPPNITISPTLEINYNSDSSDEYNHKR